MKAIINYHLITHKRGQKNQIVIVRLEGINKSSLINMFLTKHKKKAKINNLNKIILTKTLKYKNL